MFIIIIIINYYHYYYIYIYIYICVCVFLHRHTIAQHTKEYVPLTSLSPGWSQVFGNTNGEKRVLPRACGSSSSITNNNENSTNSAWSALILFDVWYMIYDLWYIIYAIWFYIWYDIWYYTNSKTKIHEVLTLLGTLSSKIRMIWDPGQLDQGVCLATSTSEKYHAPCDTINIRLI